MSEIIKFITVYFVLSMKVKWNSGYIDYRSVARDSIFVDKSLLMKELQVNDGIIKIITAPKGFGKSTNVDMIRRFFQLNVGKKGKLVKPADTQNYKVFRTGPLKVFEDWDFFGGFFNSRPVLFVDFARIHRARHFPAAVQMLKKVIRDSYKRHSYLLRVEQLWTGDFNVEHYLDVLRIRHRNLTISRLEHAFEYLSKLLYAHFKKKVYVIMDEYDAFAHIIIYKRVRGAEKIMDLFSSTIRNLLVSNPVVEGALLTGVLNVVGNGLIELSDNVQYYPFLGNHKFLKYFGTTELEAIQVICKITKNNMYERDRLTRILGENYSGFMNIVSNVTIFDTNLFKLFLTYRNDHLAWMYKEYLSNFSTATKIPKIFEKLLRLLQGEGILVNVSTQLSRDDLLLMNKMHNRSNFYELEHSEYSLNPFFYFLLQMGYLTPKHIFTNANVIAKIATLEREERLVEVLMTNIERTYSCNDDPSELYEAINRLRSGRKSKFYYYGGITYWIQRFVLESTYHIQNTTESLRNFVHLVLRYGIIKTYIHIRRPQLMSNEILMENERGTTFLIRVEFVDIYEKPKRFEFTKNIIQQMLLENRTNILDPEARKSIVLIGISYYEELKIISLAYSKYLNKGDNLQVIKVVSKHRRDICYDESWY